MIDYFNSSFLNSDRQGRFDHHTSCLKHLIISKKTPVCSLRGVLVISFSDLLFSYNNLISYNCIECYKETGFLENPETFYSFSKLNKTSKQLVDFRNIMNHLSFCVIIKKTNLKYSSLYVFIQHLPCYNRILIVA